MKRLRENEGWTMRIAVSVVIFLVALVVGARTQWVTLSKADAPSTEDRAFAAAVLGETQADATSAELIDAAVIRGEISPERALLYGMYLACDAGRLPAELRGQDSGPTARNILWEADVDWSSLSPDTRHALSDFLAAQASDAGQLCNQDIRRLADQGDVWWIAALRSDPDRATFTASRP